MHIAVVTESFSPEKFAILPWVHRRQELAKCGCHIELLDADTGFERPYDAMIPVVWLDWGSPRFKPERILPFMEKYSAFRSRFPEVTQIICNSIDMSRRAYATPYWRKGDPILYRTPAYDRRELDPFPAEDIWAFEYVWGTPCLVSDAPPRHCAGFIGSPNGPSGYRQRVAEETAKVGIGLCLEQRLPRQEYLSSIRECAIMVCPRGWGEQSLRHWDAWKSGKLVLTDADCDAVEMIPGLRLREGEHYLVYRDPAEIPDIVADWTKPARRDDFERIAENGRKAAYSYDGLERMLRFFSLVARKCNQILAV